MSKKSPTVSQKLYQAAKTGKTREAAITMKLKSVNYEVPLSIKLKVSHLPFQTLRATFKTVPTKY